MAKVMIVDDDRDFMDSICRVLQHRGHQTTAIYDTEEVIDKLEREPHEVLVLDVMFPENAAAGFHLAQEIRKHKTLTGLPILILSAINTKFPMGFGPGDIDETWMPVQDFLEKPIDFDVLSAKVEKLAGQKTSKGQ